MTINIYDSQRFAANHFQVSKTITEHTMTDGDAIIEITRRDLSRQMADHLLTKQEFFATHSSTPCGSWGR